MRCPNCNTEIDNNLNFCTNCGAKITVNHCAQCGNVLNPKMKFCTHCGARNPYSTGSGMATPASKNADTPHNNIDIKQPSFEAIKHERASYVAPAEPQPSNPVNPEPEPAQPAPAYVAPAEPQPSDTVNPEPEPAQPAPAYVAPAEPQPSDTVNPAPEPGESGQSDYEFDDYDDDDNKSKSKYFIIAGILLILAAGIAGGIWYFKPFDKHSKYAEDEDDTSKTELTEENPEENRDSEYSDYRVDEYAVAEDNTERERRLTAHAEALENARRSEGRGSNPAVETTAPSAQTPTTPAVQTPVAPPMGFRNGMNRFHGNMIHTNGNKYPFQLSFNYNSGSDNPFSDVVYVNTGSGTTLRLRMTEHSRNFVKFTGKDGKKAFILQFSGSNPYYGDAWWGDFHQDIELSLN